VTAVVEALTRAGLDPALGGSGLLVALGLLDVAHDWDVTVDADPATVRAALRSAELPFRDATLRTDPYRTAELLVVDGGDHEVDVLVGFALVGPGGTEPLPVRVTGRWRGLPLADPAVWRRAYVLLGRPERAALLAPVGPDAGT
jgi:hypothetical protein